MKRKFSKFLTLLAVTACVGVTLSSCKDTNEDLQNQIDQLHLLVLGDESGLSESLQMQINNLKAQLALYQQQLDAIKSCECDMDAVQQKLTALQNALAGKADAADVTALQNTVNTLQTTITNLQNALNGKADAATVTALQNTVTQLQNALNGKADAATVTALQNTVTTLQTTITNLQTALAGKADAADVAALKTALQQLQAALADKVSTQQLQDEITALRTFISQTYVAKSEYEAAIQRLEAAIEAAKCHCTGQCGCDLSEILARLTAVEQAALDAKALAQDAANRADAAKAAADAAQTTANEAKTTANEAKTTAESAKTIAEAAKTTADAAKALADTNKEAIDKIKLQIVSMSDSLKTAYETAAEAKTLAQGNKQLIDELTSRMTTAEEKITALQTLVNTLQGDVTQLQTDLTTLTTQFNTVVQQVTSELTRIENLANANLVAAKAYTDEQIAIVKASVATNTADIAKLKQLVDSISNVTTNIQNNMKEADDKMNARIDSLAAVAKGHEEVDAATQAKIDSIIGVITATEQRVAAIENTYVTKETFTATIDSVCTLIEANTKKIAEIDSAYQAADAIMQEKIDSLAQEVTDVKTRLDAAEDAIQELQGLKDRVDNLEENLAKMITGITLQGTHNPAFGSISLPTGFNTNVLMAYYGEANDDIYFPTSRTGRYVRPEQALTAEEMALIGLSDDTPLYNSGDVMLDDSEGNAGTLYVTINPNTVDFTGQQLTLENSQAEPSYIKLGALKASDKTLTFGWTRADGNGFYEAPATLAAEDINKVQKVSYDAAKMKSVVKEVLNKRTSANFRGIAADLYDVVTSFSLDANAAKATWTDAEGNDHSVYSGYGLAATAVKPFSFNTLYDVDGLIDNMPFYDRATALLNEVSNEVKSRIKVGFNKIQDSELAKDIQSLKINKIELKDLTPEQLALFEVSIDTTIVIDGLKYQLNFDENVNVPIHFDKNVTVSIPAQTVTVPAMTATVPAITVSMTTITTIDEDDLTVTDVNGKATLEVPVMDGGTQVGTAKVPLGDIRVSGTGTSTSSGTSDPQTIHIDAQTITINGQDVTTNIQFDDTQTVNIKMSKLFYFGDDDENGNPTDKKSVHIWVSRDMKNAAQSLWGTVKDQLVNVNDMLDDLNDIVDDANDLIDELNDYEKAANDLVDTFIGRAQSYLEKANNTFMKVFHNLNNVFQPAMLGGNDNVCFLSQIQNYPTTMKGARLHLVPTTWNLELFVPVCKKHVAITDVFKGSDSAKGGNADCKAKLEAANGSAQMNKVFNGSERNVVVENLAAGYTYEIAYSALDFHGNIATEEYYITIVE